MALLRKNPEKNNVINNGINNVINRNFALINIVIKYYV